MNERPTSVTVLAIINLVLAAFAVLGFIIWLIGQFGLMPEGPQGNPVLEIMENNTGFQLFSAVAMTLGMLATILITSASIGMFTLQPWARRVTIGWGLYTLLMTVVGNVINYLVIFRPLLADLTGPERIGMMFGMVFALVFGAVYIGYLLLMIFMLTRPKVVEAFTPETLDDYNGPTPAINGPGGNEL